MPFPWSLVVITTFFFLLRMISERRWEKPPAAPPDLPAPDPWEVEMTRAIEAASAGHQTLATDSARRALALLDGPPVDGRRLIQTLTRLASFELRAGEIEAARATIGRLSELELRGTLPLLSHAGSDLHEMLGELATSEGRTAVAESHYRAAVRIEERIAGAHAPTLLNALIELARLLRGREYLREARRRYEQLLDLRFPDPAVAAAHRRDLLLELASMLLQQGDVEGARPMIEEADQLARGAAPDESARVSAALGFSELLARQGRLGEAEEIVRELLAGLRTREASPALLAPLEQLARLLTRQGRFDEAAVVRGEMLELGDRYYGPDSPRLAYQLEELADLSVRRDEPDAAIPKLERALRVVWQANGPIHWRLPELLEKQAVLVGRNGYELQAEEYRRTAERIGDRLSRRGREN